MLERWRYGTYLFDMNPAGHDYKVDFIRDEVRTLSGATISMPTGVAEEFQIQSIFYQPRTRILSEVAVPNADAVAYHNNKFYVLNKASTRIDVYSKNLATLVSTISLAACPQKNFLCLDVDDTYVYIVSGVDAATIAIYKLNLDGSLSSQVNVAVSQPAKGAVLALGYLWILHSGNKVASYKADTLGSVFSITLPASIPYSGLSFQNGYFVSGTDAMDAIFYYFDTSSGNVVNMVSMPEMNWVNSLCFDDSKTLFAYNGAKKTVQSIKPNTVSCDTYYLEREIESHSFVNLVDDMGSVMRVMVRDYGIRRKMGYENAYDVQLTVRKVDRGA